MALKREKIVTEDLNLGVGLVTVTTDSGGTQVGTKISALSVGSPYTVETVAALTALDASLLADGDRIDTLGYATVGDGGAKSLRYDASSTAVADGGAVLIPDNIIHPAPGRFIDIDIEAWGDGIRKWGADASGVNDAVRFVDMAGDDDLDGKTRFTPKRTVAAAIKSLPRRGSGGSERYEGVVHIGPGVFVETDTPLPVSSGIQLKGSGCNPGFLSSTLGTKIKLADGQDTHLIDPEGTFTDYAHGLIIEDMELDGNVANNSGDFDILRILRPGFGCSLRNVNFINAPRWALKIIDEAVCFYAYNTTFASNTLAAIHINFKSTANLGNIAFFGTQIDNSGAVAPIHILSEADGVNCVAFYGLETEAFSSAHHEKVILMDPVSGDNGILLIAESVTAFRNGGGGASVIYIADNAGASPRIQARHISRTGYTNSFQDDKNGTAIASELRGLLSDDVIYFRSPGSSGLHSIQQIDSVTLQCSANWRPTTETGKLLGTTNFRWTGTFEALTVHDSLVPDTTGDPLGSTSLQWRVYNQVLATGSLPAAGASMDGALIIEDAGTGDRNLILYAGGERFRIDGGAAF